MSTENIPPLPLRATPRIAILVLRFVVLLFLAVALMALAWNI